MDTFPQLDSPRLSLRKIQPDDLPALVKYANNKKIADQIVNIPYPFREPQAAFRIGYVLKGFKNKTYYVFAIIHKERNELIGEVSLHLMDKHQAHGNLGYWIGEPFWNQGIATEAIRAVIQFGFQQLDLDLIYGDCYESNLASQKVLTKNGMVKHAKNGRILLLRLTRSDFDHQAEKDI